MAGIEESMSVTKGATGWRWEGEW